MAAQDVRYNLVLGVTPAEHACAELAAAVSRAGGLGILDLGAGDRASRAALVHAVDLTSGTGLGIRVPAGCALTCDDLAELLGDDVRKVDLIVLGWDSPWRIADIPDRHLVLVEVTSWQEALVAAEMGADGIVARGSESGGPVGDTGAFVLLQQLLAEERLALPVWLCGGIGARTAAAAVVGGAAGVVLDTQLALLPESDLDDDAQGAIAASDGANTEIVDGRRVLVSRKGRDDPRLPVGQDAFLAKAFADRYGTTARAVRAVVAAIHDAVRATPAITAESPLAERLGTRLPVVQGPMTRVSDQAGFAAAVAADGGLPFLALALATGEQTERMLTETAQALGDRPWGVGVLGFVAEDVRAAQLDVIRRLRPRFALIAGGRPDQAAALEEQGIATFLHVPSPGLLEQYLAAGARKFVFEGSECGGHVGPRTSFTLWEAQLAVLDGFVAAGGGAEELQLLFAGGIHDARSSAMVSALAAPLAAHGAAVGVLMGTGYLFTAEAVRHGAVGAVFQQQVLAAQRTELLETAPGHATRCVASPFVAAFHAASRELTDGGIPQRDAWQRLEDLNVGRLRIASKGLRREGDRLVGVGEDDQRELGMFMAGQVATLRSEVTSIGRLHDDVTTGAEAFYAARAEELRAAAGLADVQPTARPRDIAIVGMAAVYPGAADAHRFWANILANTDAVTEVPPDRWDAEVFYADPAGKQGPPRGDWTPSKWGGFLPRIPFDPLRYGIPPSSLSAVDTAQLLSLYVADGALHDAGYGGAGHDRSRTGVVFATAQGSDLKNANTLRMVLPGYLGPLPDALDEQLPRLSEDTLPGQLGSVVAGRVANRLDLGGVNYTVDAACASSLAALDAACKELANGTCDLMLCGAADTHNSVEDFLLFGSVGALSPSGRCRTFDSSADGIALSEGVACVALKRLADAERDGDRIYAVVKGVGGGSDGKALGLTAPRPEGQRRALERAYAAAGVSPAQVGLVEAHGTGTVLGDRTELETLTALYAESGSAPGSCALGSVKSQVGHTKCAAGLAGLIKVTLALHTGVLPPTRGIAAPNAAWEPDRSPFVFHSAPVPWPAPVAQRVAAVSAFGFGGTNFHAVLAGYSGATRHGLRDWPAEVFCFAGVDDESARRAVEKFLAVVEANAAQGDPWTLADLARTASGALREPGRQPAGVRVAVVARDLADLRDGLRAAVAGETRRGVYRADPAAESGKLAVLFPGQGSQRPGMLGELFAAFGELHRFAAADPEVAAAMFPPDAFDDDRRRAQGDRLRDTRMAQPALGIAGLAAHHLLTRLGIEADCYGGHSYGELVALTVAGAIDPAALPALSRARAEAILAAAGSDPGTMAAVAADSDAVEQLLRAADLDGRVVVANHNAPGQVVISGDSDGVAVALQRLRDAGLAAKQLPVACAFHSPVIRGAGARFAEELLHHRIAAPDRPVWANRTAGGYPGDPADVAAELAAQVVSPVRFADQIEAMYADGVRSFVEAGPGRVLAGLVGKILGDRPHTVVGLENANGDGLTGFLHAVAQLAVSGIRVRTGWLFAGRGARDVSGLTPPRRPNWTVDGAAVRTSDGNSLPGGLRPARRISIEETPVTHPQSAAAQRDAMVSEFLRTSREMISAQRDVLLSYLGTPVPSQLAAPAAPMPVLEPAPAHLASPAPVAPESPAPGAPGSPSGPVDVLGTVIDVIAQRSGYPVEMVTPELDLEADLSIDSIKRTEIAGELVAALGLDPSGDLDPLTKARTAAALADALTARIGRSGEPNGAAPEPAESAALVEAPSRFVMELVDAAPVEQAGLAAFAGANVVIAGGADVLVEELAGELSARGAMPFVIGAEQAVPETILRADLVISLHATDTDGEPADGVLPAGYPLLRDALARGPKVLLVVSGAGPVVGRRAAGLRGFARAAALEYPDTVVRLVELDLAAGTVATEVVDELFTPGTDPVVVRAEGSRKVFAMTPANLGSLATTGGGPAGIGAAEATAMGLDADSVVLLIGGARGITARVAMALAETAGCRIELAGRTALAEAAEPEELLAAADLPALRGALARLGHGEPAEIERAARQILAQREVADTLRRLRAIGCKAEYHQLDVRDGQAVTRLVKQIHADRGRIDGVVHAAGVVDDRLIADKAPDSFARVYGTKVDGADALLAELEQLPARPRFVVFFGSIVAVRGNRGQADYAAANDALEALGALSVARAGGRVITVHWGPWAPAPGHGGMITPELARNYAGRGIALLNPADAVDCLLRELAWGPSGASAVVYTASGWEAP